MANCRWCNRRLTALIARPAEQEKPHCPGNADCTWGWDCYVNRAKAARTPRPDTDR